jgi:transcriptional regulator with XRE-family HTH domain
MDNKEKNLKEREVLAKRLNEIISTLGISQNKFANEIKWNQALISKIMKGKTYVSDKLIDAICAGHNVNKNWFLTGEGEMFCPKAESFPITDVDGNPLNEEEAKFIGTYRKLIPPNKEVAQVTVDALLKAQLQPENVVITPATQGPELRQTLRGESKE